MCGFKFHSTLKQINNVRNMGETYLTRLFCAKIKSLPIIQWL